MRWGSVSDRMRSREWQEHAQELLAPLGHEGMPRVHDQMQLRARNPRRQQLRILRRYQCVLGTRNHERRRLDLRQSIPGLKRIASFELALECERRGGMLEQARYRSLQLGTMCGDVFRGVAQRPSAAKHILGRHSLPWRGKYLQ